MHVFEHLLGPKCATGAVLPANYLTSSDSSYLPGFGPKTTAPAPSKLSWVPLAAGAVLIGGVLYFVAKGAAPVLANPMPDDDKPLEIWELKSVARTYGFTSKELHTLIGRRSPTQFAEILRKHEHWRETVGLPAKNSPLSRGHLRDALLPRANPGLPDGAAKRKHFTARDADPRELARGTKHEMEHTRSKRIARQIALDHLSDDDKYYTHLAAAGVKGS